MKHPVVPCTQPLARSVHFPCLENLPAQAEAPRQNRGTLNTVSHHTHSPQYSLGNPLAVFKCCLFVCFCLNFSGFRKNDNLWKSLRCIVVNGAPREVPQVLNGVPREYIEGPLGVFFWQTLGLRPRVCLQKTPRGPSMYSLGTPLSPLGNLPRDSIHHTTP